jgi:hypothetical protein
MTALAVLACVLVGGAEAHHDAAIAPVASMPVFEADEETGPSLSAGIAWDTAVFGRVLQGQEPFAGATGRVTRHTATHRVAWTPIPGSRIEARVPVVVLDAVALGDVELEVGQAVRSETLQLAVTGGVAAPTGVYTRDPVMQAQTVSVDATAIELVTTDVRASAGAGAWTGLAGVHGIAALGGWQVLGFGSARVPLTDTVDAIRWGPLLAGSAGVLGSLGGGRLRAGVHADVRHQLAHRFDMLDAHTGKQVERRSGRQSVVGVRPVVAARIWSAAPERRSARLDCDVGVHIPVWQHVQGVQLAETASGRVGCTMLAQTGRSK